jgi:cytosylglucuronate decarboxylase
MMLTPRPEYLFIRILETCNADCFMCEFALSKDKYRFPESSLRAMLPAASEAGVRFVRLTGGEPLVHKEVIELIRTLTTYDMTSSLITNGWFLSRDLPALIDAGLDQVIVSIDGVRETHDAIRGTKGLFDRAMEGVETAVGAGIKVRVNTTCGPRNFRDMPALQKAFTALGVTQWELSSLKLERPLEWSEADRKAIDNVVFEVYDEGFKRGYLPPMGKVWCGEPGEERDRYLRTGITPRPDDACLVVRHVRYLDARNGLIFPCSLLPHRPGFERGPVAPPPTAFTPNPTELMDYASWFEEHGPETCTGCSATAAGWSNDLRAGDGAREWAF